MIVIKKVKKWEIDLMDDAFRILQLAGINPNIIMAAYSEHYGGDDYRAIYINGETRIYIEKDTEQEAIDWLLEKVHRQEGIIK